MWFSCTFSKSRVLARPRQINDLRCRFGSDTSMYRSSRLLLGSLLGVEYRYGVPNSYLG
jgi:hypothetical protein